MAQSVQIIRKESNREARQTRFGDDGRPVFVALSRAVARKNGKKFPPLTPDTQPATLSMKIANRRCLAVRAI